MTDNLSISEGREIPETTEDLQDFLAKGPSVPTSSVQPEIPPMPTIDTLSAVAEVPLEDPKSEVLDPPVPDEGPDEEAKKLMMLPNEAQKALLKKKYGDNLKVVPLPYARGDGKIQTYILRQLNRAQWRAMEADARKIAESKPGIPAEEIFQEKIISLAVVWPRIDESTMQIQPAGLIQTLFGITQQMGLFFNPEAIMSVTFTL